VGGPRPKLSHMAVWPLGFSWKRKRHVHQHLRRGIKRPHGGQVGRQQRADRTGLPASSRLVAARPFGCMGGEGKITNRIPASTCSPESRCATLAEPQERMARATRFSLALGLFARLRGSRQCGNERSWRVEESSRSTGARACGGSRRLDLSSNSTSSCFSCSGVRFRRPGSASTLKGFRQSRVLAAEKGRFSPGSPARCGHLAQPQDTDPAMRRTSSGRANEPCDSRGLPPARAYQRDRRLLCIVQNCSGPRSLPLDTTTLSPIPSCERFGSSSLAGAAVLRLC
jgi:hypothetical protein